MRRTLVVVCLILTAAGCARKGELTILAGGTPRETAYWEKVLERFEDSTGIEVGLIRSATHTEQKKQAVLVALRGRKSDPDVILMDVAWIGQMAHSGWLEPLGPHGVDPAPFYERVIDLADMHDGTLVGLPVYVDGGLLYYRSDLLAAHGHDSPPRTWNELRETAIAIQEARREENPDFWGFVWQGAQYEGLVCNALEFFVSAGGGIVDSAGRPVLDSEENKRALRWMVDLIHRDKLSPPNTYTDMREEEVRMVFQSGNALFERNWPYAWASHQEPDSPVKGKVGMAPLPHFDGGSSASTLGGWHVVVSAFSDRTADAVDLMNFITSYEVQKDFALDLGWNPGRRDVYEDEELLEKNRALATLRDVFDNAVPRPPVPYYSQISNVLQERLNAALAGREKPGDALREAQNEVEEIVRRYEHTP